MTQVTLRGLTKTYPGASVPALQDLSLTVASGAMVALLGPSGCGKTTAMKMIAGLVAPTAGDVAFDGRSVLRDAPDTRGAVMVFQNALLFPTMTVAENVGFGLRMRKVSAGQIADRVARMLALVQLPGLGDRAVVALSGGQQQRVALARALIVQPRVLLLDEPLSNLDAHLRMDMRDLITSVQRALGITTVLVTHDQEEAVMLADTLGLILNGRLHQYGAASAFFDRPASIAVARFFGGQNFVTGQVSDGVFDCALGQLIVPDELARGAGILTIRPEVVGIGAGPANTLHPTVMDRIYLGTQVRLKLRIGPQDLQVLCRPDQAQDVAVGQTIAINLPPRHIWVLPEG